MTGSMAFCISGGKQYWQQRAAFWAGLCICRQHCAVNEINAGKIIRCLLLPQFAVRHLEADGILYLEQHTGRSKKIVLTDKGKKFVEETIGKLRMAEIQTFEAWSEEEIDTYTRLLEKYADYFQRQVEKM